MPSRTRLGADALHRLVYVEAYPYVNKAIAREKQLKRWSHVKKAQLIDWQNFAWVDLSADWYGTSDVSTPDAKGRVLRTG